MAPKQAKKRTAEDEGSTFSRFSLLPLELRRMVWGQAFPPPVFQVLIYKPTIFPKWDPITNNWDAADGPPLIAIPPPAVLHTTRESRAFALERVTVHKEKKVPTLSTAPSAYHHIVCRPFDRDIDALFVQKTRFHAFVAAHTRNMPWAAGHIIFDTHLPRRGTLMRAWGRIRWEHDLYQAADKWCPGLRSVAVVQAPMCRPSLDREAAGDHVPRGYYRALPASGFVDYLQFMDHFLRGLGNGFRRDDCPFGTPWGIRTGSDGAFCEEEEDEWLVECLDASFQPFTGRTCVNYETWKVMGTKDG